MANGDEAAAAGMDVVPSTAKRRLGYDEINKTRDYIVRFIAALWPLPIGKGGTGAVNAAAARTALAITAVNVPSEGVTGDTVSNLQTDIEYIWAFVGTPGGGYLPLTGGTISGQLFLPAASVATSNYVVGYINGDGRVSRGASSRRYKSRIKAAPRAALDGLFEVPLREFEMLGGDGTRRLGYIAEELDENPATRRFVVRIDDQVEAIDDIQMLRAQVVSLHDRLALLEQRGS